MKEPLDLEAMERELDIADPPDEKPDGGSAQLVRVVARHARNAISELRELRAELAQWRGLIHPATEKPNSFTRYFGIYEYVNPETGEGMAGINAEFYNNGPWPPKEIRADFLGYFLESELAEHVLNQTKGSEE